MQRLKKFLDYMQNMNAMPYMVWAQIYPKGEVPKESQQVMIDWLNKNNLGLSEQPRLGCVMLINTKTLKHLSTKEIREICPEWYKPEKRPERVKIDFTTLTCNKFDKNIKSGWLDTFGQFTELDWGDHSLFAREYIEINDLRERKRNFSQKTGLLDSKDFLIGELNFVLFDCPANNGYVKITYHTGHLTRKQDDYIAEYLIAINDKDTLAQILGE